jgi:hypothetical protein
LPPGLARRLDGAIDLALAQADVLGCPSQSRQQVRLAVIQSPTARPVQGSVPVPLGLPGDEPHQMSKVLRPAVAVPGRCPGGPFWLRIEPLPDGGPVDPVSGRLVTHHRVGVRLPVRGAPHLGRRGDDVPTDASEVDMKAA